VLEKTEGSKNSPSLKTTLREFDDLLGDRVPKAINLVSNISKPAALNRAGIEFVTARNILIRDASESDAAELPKMSDVGLCTEPGFVRGHIVWDSEDTRGQTISSFVGSEDGFSPEDCW